MSEGARLKYDFEEPAEPETTDEDTVAGLETGVADRTAFILGCATALQKRVKGCGATFTVTLPLAAQSELAVAELRAPPARKR
jgi:hypothetical protein